MRRWRLHVGEGSLEKRQRQNLARVSSFLRTNLEHVLDAEESVIADARQVFLQVLLRVLIKNDFSLFRELVAFAPLVTFGCAQYLEDFINLVKFASAREKRLLQIKLGHNAPGGEDVRIEVVVVRAEDALRRPVPPR